MLNFVNSIEVFEESLWRGKKNTITNGAPIAVCCTALGVFRAIGCI